jgi:hypothetical protein
MKRGFATEVASATRREELLLVMIASLWDKNPK